jgi:hypothetical protein
LKVIAADGPRQHGLILDMAICDELHAHARRDLYDALRTSMLKRPGARMVTITTAGATLDTPLGELRERALKLPRVERDGALTRAEGDHLAMLQWALPGRRRGLGPRGGQAGESVLVDHARRVARAVCIGA